MSSIEFKLSHEKELSVHQQETPTPVDSQCGTSPDPDPASCNDVFLMEYYKTPHIEWGLMGGIGLNGDSGGGAVQLGAYLPYGLGVTAQLGAYPEQHMDSVDLESGLVKRNYRKTADSIPVGFYWQAPDILINAQNRGETEQKALSLKAYVGVGADLHTEWSDLRLVESVDSEWETVSGLDPRTEFRLGSFWETGAALVWHEGTGSENFSASIGPSLIGFLSGDEKSNYSVLLNVKLGQSI